MRLIDADALDDVITRLNFNENWGITRGEYKLINSVLFEFPTLDVVPVTFERFQSVCKFFAVGFDEDRKKELTCRRKDMIPEGCSWGICDKEHCPYMKEEEV